MPQRIFRIACGLLLSAGLAVAAGTTLTFKEVVPGTPISAKGKTGLTTVTFKRFVSSIENGEVIGPMNAGWLNVDRGSYKWNEKAGTEIHQAFKLKVNKELEAYGYPTPKKRDTIFETESKPGEEGLELGVLLRTMKGTFHIDNSRKLDGGVYFEMRWALFNPKTQKVVLEMPVEASFKGEEVTWDDMIGNAIAAATDTLMANPAFLAALSAPAEAAAAAGDAPAYTFPAIPLHKGGAVKNTTSLCAAVVTVEVNNVSGSGFYITRDGYLLTDRHVVGDAKFVKIRTATGRELPGEVIGENVHRDVALIKTMKVPFEPLGLRQVDPTVGEEVYAIGSPLGDQFNGSLTRGVVSGFRADNNTRFLQSDVSVLPGNSGGPLVDANGAVVGIAVIALGTKGGSLNFFIPIADALTALSIQIKSGDLQPAAKP